MFGEPGQAHRFRQHPARAEGLGVSGRFAEIEFDFELPPAAEPAAEERRDRVRALEA
ncbi:MAG: hypothetical protein PGN19_14705 [Pseudomonas oryzihabitans]